MRMERVPLDAIADEVIPMCTAVVVDSVQVRLETTVEPPRTVVVLGAVVVEALVVVVVMRAERLAVVRDPVCRQWVARRATVANMQTPQWVFTFDATVNMCVY